MTVEPEIFAKAMTKHWEAPPLSNVSSDSLREVWADMADTFNRHIKRKVKEQWSILQLPTGAGKTQGLSLYCSMLPEKNHPGVLIVTNLIREAEIIAADINRMSRKSGTALLCHADNKKEVMAFIPSAPVLIVTHNAYKISWEDEERAELYSQWNGGRRKLTVIDEALDIVEGYQVTIDDLRFLRGIIPQYIANDFFNEIKAIDEAIEKIAVAMVQEDGEIGLLRFESGVPDFYSLLGKIKGLPLSHFIPGDIEGAAAGILREAAVKKCEKIFKNLKAISSDWSIYARAGNYYSLGTARFLLPPDMGNAVVLDATASENPVAKMLGKRFDLRQLPNGVKKYGNVKLHVSYGHNVGKTHIEKQGAKHFQKLISDLEPIMPREGRAFICVHKSSEAHLNDLSEDRFSFAHWYAVNGSNAHNDCRSAIIYGLPYLSQEIAINFLLAFLLWQSNIENTDGDKEEFLRSAKKYARDYILRHIIVSIVQAINRIRCRKISDDQGNCPKVDVYLYLGKKETQDGQPSDGEKIIRAIGRLMPGIDIEEWDAPKLMDEDKDRKFSNSEISLIDYFDLAPPGRHEFEAVSEQTGLSLRTMQRLSTLLSRKDGDTDFSRRLSKVTYYSKKGPGGGKYFIKSAL